MLMQSRRQGPGPGVSAGGGKLLFWSTAASLLSVQPRQSPGHSWAGSSWKAQQAQSHC